MTDSEIVSLFWARDERAIESAASKYERYLKTVASGILKSDEDVKECLNDAYMAAWNAIPPSRPAILSAYLAKITRNTCLKKWRAQSAKKRGGGEVQLALDELNECIPDRQDIGSSLETQALTAAVNAFLAHLPETERRVFLMRYWYMQPISAISARFCFSESKVKSMLHRMRGKLKNHLSEEGVYFE